MINTLRLTIAFVLIKSKYHIVQTERAGERGEEERFRTSHIVAYVTFVYSTLHFLWYNTIYIFFTSACILHVCTYVYVSFILISLIAKASLNDLPDTILCTCMYTCAYLVISTDSIKDLAHWHFPDKTRHETLHYNAIPIRSLEIEQKVQAGRWDRNIQIKKKHCKNFCLWRNRVLWDRIGNMNVCKKSRRITCDTHEMKCFRRLTRRSLR